MDNRSISANDLQTHQKDFTAKVKVDQTPYSRPSMLIKWKLLENIMRPLKSSDPRTGQGTKWYVGWDGTSLRIAFAPLLLNPGTNPGEYDILESDRFELVEQGQLWILKQITDWSTRWKGNKDAYVDRYYQVTTIDRENKGFVNLDPLKDPCASIIAWDWALEEMFKQNSQPGDDPELLELKVIHGASWANGGDGGLMGFRHLLCFNICYNSIDRLEQSKEDPTRPYFNRGANYAQPCPALCTTYVVR